MKRITGIDERLVHFNADVPKEEAAKLPTYRALFVTVLGTSQAKDPAEALMIFAAANRLKAPGDAMDLDDAEFNALREKCERNPVGWLAYYHAQVLLKLKASEEGK